MREDSCALTHGVKHLFLATYINMFPLRVTSPMLHKASFATSHLLSASDGDDWFQQRHLTLSNFRHFHFCSLDILNACKKVVLTII